MTAIEANLLRRKTRSDRGQRGAAGQAFRVAIFCLAAILAVHLFMRFDDHPMASAASPTEGVSSTDAPALDDAMHGGPAATDMALMMLTCLAVGGLFAQAARLIAGSLRSGRCMPPPAAMQMSPATPQRHPPWRPWSLVAQSVLILS